MARKKKAAMEQGQNAPAQAQVQQNNVIPQPQQPTHSA
ncbi:Uncharacterised protein [uncultured archaeon]|nr:Uncharacterised protein [uncultured archaeon]